MRHTINKGRVSYAPASLDDHNPDEVTPATGGFVSYPEPLGGTKIRVRSESFGDHFGQAKLFWNSMTPPEKEHIAKALQFELSHVETRKVRQRMIGNLEQINPHLASQVAAALGEKHLATVEHVKPGGTADSALETKALANATSPTTASGGVQSSKPLSMIGNQTISPKGRKVAILVEVGVDAGQVKSLVSALLAQGAKGEVVGPHLGALDAVGGSVEATKTFATASSVLYDAVYVPGGSASASVLVQSGDVLAFIAEAYKHAKAIGSKAEGSDVIAAALVNAAPTLAGLPGVFDSPADPAPFIQAIGDRHWGRPGLDSISV